MALASRDRVKGMLGIVSVVTKHDTKIDNLLDEADSIVLQEIGLTGFSETSYNHTYSFDYATDVLAFYKFPLMSVVALTVNGVAYADGTDFEVDYELDQIELSKGDFPIGRHLVSVCYTAGFENGSNDLKNLTYAACLIVTSLFNQEAHLGYLEEEAGE